MAEAGALASRAGKGAPSPSSLAPPTTTFIYPRPPAHPQSSPRQFSLFLSHTYIHTMTSRINIPNRQPPAATPSYQPPPPSYSTRPSAHGRNSSQMAGLAQSFGIDNDAIQQVRGYTSKVEDAIETIGRPLKPYLPAAARSVTFSSCSHSRLSVFSSLHAWYTGNGCIFHSGLDLVELCWARPASRPGARPFSNRSASEQPASLDVDAGSAACGLSHHASYKRHHPLLPRPPSLSPILEGRSTPRRPARAASKVSRSLPRLPGGARRGDKKG